MQLHSYACATPSTKLSCVVCTYVRATPTITKLSCCMHQAPSYPVLYVPTYVPHPLSQSFPVVCTKHQAILCCTYLCTCHTHYYKAFLCCMHQAPVLYVPTYVPHPLSQSFPVVCTKHQAIQCCTYLRTCHTHYYKAFLCCMHQAPVLYVPTYVPHPLSQSFPVLYAPSTKLSCVVRTYVRATPTITKLSCVVCTKHQAFLCCMHQAPVLYVPTYVPHPLSQSFPVVCTKHQAIQCCTYLRTCHTHYYKAFLCCMHQAPVLYVPTYVPHPLSQSFPVVCTKHQAIQCCTYLRTCHTHSYKAFLCCMHLAPSYPVLYVRATPTITKLSCIVHTFIHTCTCHTHCHKAFLCCLYVHATPTITYLCTDASCRCSHCMNLITRMLSNPTLSASWA